MAGARELLRGGEPGRTRADHGDALACSHRRGVWRDPPLVPCPVDDLDFDLLDGDGVLVDAEHTRRLARRRTQPARELGEVVGGVEALDGVVPVVAIDEIVPVRDQVAERTAVVAERDPAVHAPTRLVRQGIGIELFVHLLPVAQPHRDGATLRRLPIPLQEPGRFTHEQPP